MGSLPIEGTESTHQDRVIFYTWARKALLTAVLWVVEQRVVFSSTLPAGIPTCTSIGAVVESKAVETELPVSDLVLPVCYGQTKKFLTESQRVIFFLQARQDLDCRVVMTGLGRFC